jgi:hypothetical protein
MRVCQFRHDGKWTFIAAATHSSPCLEDLHFYSTDTTPTVKPRAHSLPSYSSFAFIVIFAFSTFDTGHPFSAASAYF